jgi:ATP-dependent Clp protease ATP-binding subunit ClpC
MFERFTERARRIVVHAQEEARKLNHNYIGTEHLLLGLLREPESVAARALRELDISLDAARGQVIEIIGRGTESPSGHIPFTPRAKKVLELSLREALQLGHNYIGTEHILLGMIREGEGVAAQVLTTLGGTPERVRDKVIELAPAGTGEAAELTEENPELSAQLRRVGLGGPVEAVRRRLAAIDERLEVIAERLEAIERHLGIERDDGRAEGGGDRPAAGE